MTPIDYWSECINTAADECGLLMTPEQLDCLADAVKLGHEQYGMAFYSPPDSDRIAVIQAECTAKMKAQQDEHERYVRNSEVAIRKALRVHSDDHVTIEEYGEVFRHGGRTEQIQ